MERIRLESGVYRAHKNVERRTSEGAPHFEANQTCDHGICVFPPTSIPLFPAELDAIIPKDNDADDSRPQGILQIVSQRANEVELDYAPRLGRIL
jgi:hypothetical protein